VVFEKKYEKYMHAVRSGSFVGKVFKVASKTLSAGHSQLQ
jgi:hypothetical protein